MDLAVYMLRSKAPMPHIAQTVPWAQTVVCFKPEEDEEKKGNITEC